MKGLNRIGIIVMINIYLVIIAGSVVRMTGSGMGCPDWPKCFGYLIPPTQEEDILWEENKSFEKGQLIIHTSSNIQSISSGEIESAVEDKTLLSANKSFTTSSTFNPVNWDKYTKHDYAEFNVYHTWTEYINRLMGALLGFFAFIQLILSIKKWKTNKASTWLSILLILFIGFEAWLGKITVDNNLAPVTITYHMLGVLILIIIQLLFFRKINSDKNKVTTKWFYLIPIALVLLTIQIILGTQVRQEVDHFLETGIDRSLLADQFGLTFYIHRSFSIVLAIIIGFISWHFIQSKVLIKRAYITLALLVLEIGIGMFLFYLGMQAYGQPFHLLLSLLLFGFLVTIMLSTSKK